MSSPARPACGTAAAFAKVWLSLGDFLYIPADVPHLPYSASATEPCVGVIARTDPNEQESVTLLEIPDPGMAPQ